ncbi:peptidoglycan editing factor PgeF [Frankia sp. AgB1.9]|uniref:peptidoglycan editing factor PgeF n=1 Tax=unclassified Frankia TaxID=2632575 RepID=UPI0019332F4F|nr:MULTISPECIES: peptidoglycan editing factor PgeF [unclassified Frankia]MBL7490319.1 peptidoglycan editing factor PgeF [Frankia sp. AgW1.1]MBL7546772.1 peptidoglycan editing factor PgeF [Frankia sp. AgB1.9]MBL7623760.1 peptidoglycan editing factor PgeF [Frankia sp. AgB1.8]
MPFLFTDRSGGVSAGPYAGLNLGAHVGDDPEAVAANRRVLAEITGAPACFMRQVHGAVVVTLSERTRADWFRDGALGSAPERAAARDADSRGEDGLVTDVPGLALTVLVADCVPVVFTAPGAVGVAHAGRAGLAAGVVPATVAALADLGAAPEHLHVEVGPSVCGRCYEVPAAMRDEVEALVPGTATATRAGTPALDLRAGVAGQLRDLGVTDITVSDRCTMEDPALFSHRRDAGRTGRFAGVAWL